MSNNKKRLSFSYNGKRYEVYGYTQEELQQKKNLKLEELKLCGTSGNSGTQITLNEWFEQFITVYKIGVEPTTIYNYRLIYKNTIKPKIGFLPLSEISQVHCQLILNSIQDKSGSYIRKTNILLKGIFKKAVANRLIYHNPAEGLILPHLNDGQRRALTPSEREEFLKTCDELGKKGLLFKVIYFCGLRPSEAYRIKGIDINRETHILHVRGKKTKAAERDVFIPDDLGIPSLEDNELLFANEVGKPLTKTQLQRYWATFKRIYENVNGHPIADDLTPYCLRHDYCTRLQEANIPIDIARRLMGHSSIEVTSKIYTHGTETSLNYAAGLMNAFYQK